MAGERKKSDFGVLVDVIQDAPIHNEAEATHILSSALRKRFPRVKVAPRGQPRPDLAVGGTAVEVSYGLDKPRRLKLMGQIRGLLDKYSAVIAVVYNNQGDNARLLKKWVTANHLPATVVVK